MARPSREEAPCARRFERVRPKKCLARERVEERGGEVGVGLADLTCRLADGVAETPREKHGARHEDE